MPSARASFGFSLIELLVVAAIVVILAAMLMPAMSLVRKAADRVNCASNMRQFGIAFLAYASDNDGFAPQIAQYTPPGPDFVHAFGNYVWVTLKDDGLTNESVLACPTVRRQVGEPPSWNKSSYRYNSYLGGCANPVTLADGNCWLQSRQLGGISNLSGLVVFSENGGTFNTANNSLPGIWLHDTGHYAVVHNVGLTGGTHSSPWGSVPNVRGASNFLAGDGSVQSVEFSIDRYPLPDIPGYRVPP